MRNRGIDSTFEPNLSLIRAAGQTLPTDQARGPTGVSRSLLHLARLALIKGLKSAPTTIFK
jgi:hypothetical protein